MDTLSHPVLSADLPAYVANLAARVERLEQGTAQRRCGEHTHDNPHSHCGIHGPHHIGPCSHSPRPHCL